MFSKLNAQSEILLLNKQLIKDQKIKNIIKHNYPITTGGITNEKASYKSESYSFNQDGILTDYELNLKGSTFQMKMFYTENYITESFNSGDVINPLGSRLIDGDKGILNRPPLPSYGQLNPFMYYIQNGLNNLYSDFYKEKKSNCYPSSSNRFYNPEVTSYTSKNDTIYSQDSLNDLPISFFYQNTILENIIIRYNEAGNEEAGCMPKMDMFYKNKKQLRYKANFSENDHLIFESIYGDCKNYFIKNEFTYLENGLLDSGTKTIPSGKFSVVYSYEYY